MSDLKNILNNTGCISAEDIQNYLNKSSSRQEVHRIESHLNECEFCNEAVEGYQLAHSSYVVSGTEKINNQIDQKLKKGFSIQYLIAAASISVILFFGAIFMLRNTTQTEQLSVKTESVEEKLTEDKMAPKTLKDEEKEGLVEEDNSSKNEVTLMEQEVLKETRAGVEQVESDAKELPEIDLVDDPQEEENSYDDQAHYFGDEDIVEEEQMEMTSVESTNKSLANAPSSQSGVEVTEVYGNDNFKELPEIDFNRMLALLDENEVELEEVVVETKTTSRKKESSYDAGTYSNEAGSRFEKYSNKNQEEIDKQIALVKAEKHQKSLSQINKMINKDVWSAEEKATLYWLKSICELKLNLSAQESLQMITRYPNTYQLEAQKIYNQLYQ